MTKKEFFNKVTNSKEDFLQKIINILKENKISYCIIGGLAVNAYCEPVVSLDLDIVIGADRLNSFASILRDRYSLKKFPNSINVKNSKSELRLQIQSDPRYLPFIEKAKSKTVLGYRIQVARIEDVFQGKVWAVLDKTRRESKRQKDLADIMRLIETKKELIKLLPETLKNAVIMKWK